MKRIFETVEDWLRWFQFIHNDEWYFGIFWHGPWPNQPDQWYHGGVYKWMFAVGHYEVRRWTKKPKSK